MVRDQGALRAACGAVLAAVALSACAGDDDGRGSEQAKDKRKIGEGRVATNESPEQVGRGTDGRDGVLEGVPSFDTLDRSAPPPGALGSGQSSCSGGSLRPAKSNLRQVARATLCLINAERKTRGLSGLRVNRKLARAALDQARDMVRRAYFAHNSVNGATFVSRIKRRGYMSGQSRWTVGENLGWGSGTKARPREIVDAWMESPPHRANILNGRFREIGLGIALGAPARGAGSSAATYNTAFGARRAG